MTPLTPRQHVVRQIEDTATRTGRPHWDLWKKLYDEFERIDGHAVRRWAHNTGRTELDTVEEEGWMPELMSRAQKYLPTIPALPVKDKEKAPGQGSFSKETA